MTGDRNGKFEVGPVVVPNEWDYAAASMRPSTSSGETKSEQGSWNSEERAWRIAGRTEVRKVK